MRKTSLLLHSGTFEKANVMTISVSEENPPFEVI